MMLVLYGAAYLVFMLALSWVVPILIVWYFFDVPFPMALLLGALIGGFISAVLNCIEWTPRRWRRRKKGCPPHHEPPRGAR